MATHELKIIPEHFTPVAKKIKTAELRKNDRDFQPGDVLVLMCWDRIGQCYSGHSVVRTITHIADVSEWLPGFVLISME
ncbi:MAG TPA: RNA-binding protein [Pantoea sp.]|nr:RNA-binding protein [Pantoea sp.]